jgi:hypothetical protein
MSQTSFQPDQPQTCGVCYKDAPTKDMANLTDKNGAAWYVCPDCITGLWNLKRPPLTEPPPQPYSADADALTTCLATFVGAMVVIRDLLPEGTPNSLTTAMDREIATARKAYTS